jgi:hypothetical protein
MTPEITKLIKDGRWQPIENAPREQRPFLVKLPRIMNLVVRSWFNTTHKQWESDRDTDGGITKVEFYHEGDLYRLLPDNRLADALEVALVGLESIIQHQKMVGGNLSDLSVTRIIAEKKLAEIQAIAERKE